MKPYSIRVAKESDVDCFAEMRFALQTHTEKSNPDIWRFSDEGREQFKEQSIELFSDPDAQVLLALNDKGEAIGMVVGKIHRNPKCIPNISGSVEHLFVKEEYRKRGVGTELVLTLCEFFSSQGAEDISVRYVVGNREGEEFWKRLGFQPRIITAGVKQQRILEKISTAKHEQWAATMQSEHFIYRVEGERPWSPETILELLEACYREYYEMMGPGLKTLIEVEDKLSPSGKRAARRINGRIICEFPPGFGYEQHEQKLAYHFFAHEVFHHWVGGYTVSHGVAIEALTQYMANHTLVKLGFVAPDQLIRDHQQRQRQIDAGVMVEFNRYYFLFENLEQQKGEATLYRLCQQLAECFQKAESVGEKADVAPILRSFLGSDSIKADYDMRKELAKGMTKDKDTFSEMIKNIVREEIEKREKTL